MTGVLTREHGYPLSVAAVCLCGGTVDAALAIGGCNGQTRGVFVCKQEEALGTQL